MAARAKPAKRKTAKRTTPVSWRPDDETRQAIRAKAALGMSPANIALGLGVDEKALLAAASAEIDAGRLEGEEDLRRNLKKLADNGDARAIMKLATDFSGVREELVGTTELASWLCCSQPIISELAGAGIIEASGRNLWRLKECVNRLVTHLRATAAARSPGRPTDAMSPAQRVAHETAKAKARENAEAEGLLIKVDVYERHVSGILKSVAQAYDVIPDVLESECGLTPAQVVAVQRILDQSRNGLADSVAGNA